MGNEGSVYFIVYASSIIVVFYHPSSFKSITRVYIIFFLKTILERRFITQTRRKKLRMVMIDKSVLVN